MNSKVVLLILATACVALLVALIAMKNKATKEQEVATETILHHSNQWQETTIELNKAEETNQVLQTELQKRETAYANLEKNYQNTTSTLASTEGTLKDTVASLRAAEEEIAQRDARIADLEGKNEALDARAADLSNAIGSLTSQIEETQQQLAMAEGDKALLQSELKRLMAEKAELERQLNDVTVLKAQISKLRSELAVSRRLDWIRRGLIGGTETKGATLLMQGVGKPKPKEAEPKKPAYDLNVEITEDGTVRVIPPITNTPGEIEPEPVKP